MKYNKYFLTKLIVVQAAVAAVCKKTFNTK